MFMKKFLPQAFWRGERISHIKIGTNFVLMGVFMKNKNKNKLTEDMGNMKTRLQKLSHGDVKIGECPFDFAGE